MRLSFVLDNGDYGPGVGEISTAARHSAAAFGLSAIPWAVFDSFRPTNCAVVCQSFRSKPGLSVLASSRVSKVTSLFSPMPRGTSTYLEVAGHRLVAAWGSDHKSAESNPNQFGYVDQLCEITANTRRGARGFVLPPSSQIGNPAEETLLPATAAELTQLGIKLREVMVDGGFKQAPTNTALEGLADEVHIAGRQENGSRRTRRRRHRYRTGVEGRVSHLKRGYGLRRSRLKGDEGHQIWDGWAAFTYNTETFTTSREGTPPQPTGNGRGAASEPPERMTTRHNEVTSAAIPHPSVSAAAFIRRK